MSSVRLLEPHATATRAASAPVIHAHAAWVLSAGRGVHRHSATLRADSDTEREGSGPIEHGEQGRDQPQADDADDAEADGCAVGEQAVPPPAQQHEREG